MQCLAAASEQKIALLIGNSAYPGNALRNPVNDARAMAAKLGSLGFEVILRTDASQRDMTRAVSQFGDKLKGGSVGLFYFAGHGIQVRGKNYLIPIDAEINSESSTRSEAVDVDQVLEQLGPARLSMVILDACRNNPFERRFRSSGTGGLAQIDAPTGTMLAYATAPGKVAYDGSGVNGLYTTELLKALDTPGLKVEDIFKQVRINVLKASDNQQIPWESSSLTGEFYFRPDVKPVAAAISVQQADRERVELQKSLEEERRRRDQDVDLVKREMENLRKELLALRQIAAAAPSAPAADSKQTAAAAQQQIALAKPASVPPETNPAATGPNDATPLPAASAAEWKQRIALLEQSKGNLTFSKALALLLDVANPDDLAGLVRFERSLEQSAYSNALAMGLDGRSGIHWVRGMNFSGATLAFDAVRELCDKGAGSPCRIIYSNREFREKDFMELVDQFRKFDFGKLRESYFASVRTPPSESKVPNGHGTGRQYATIFTSQR